MTPAGERRRSPRVEPVSGGPASHGRLRASGDVRVRDIASAGVRVEGPRLLPGVRVDLHLIGAAGRQLVRGRVVWARVRAVAPLVYEAAVVFDAPFDVLPEGYRVPAGPAPLLHRPAAGYPVAGLRTAEVPESAGKRPAGAAGRPLGSVTAGGDRRDDQPATG